MERVGVRNLNSGSESSGQIMHACVASCKVLWNVYMFFTGRGVPVGKNCALGLEYGPRPLSFSSVLRYLVSETFHFKRKIQRFVAPDRLKMISLQDFPADSCYRDHGQR